MWWAGRWFRRQLRPGHWSKRPTYFLDKIYRGFLFSRQSVGSHEGSEIYFPFFFFPFYFFWRGREREKAISDFGLIETNQRGAVTLMALAIRSPITFPRLVVPFKKAYDALVGAFALGPFYPSNPLFSQVCFYFLDKWVSPH